MSDALATHAPVLCPDLEVPHAPGANLVWASPGAALPAHPRFAVPLARAGAPFRFRGQEVLGFGVWSSWTEPDAAWKARAAQAVVHFPRYTDAELESLEGDALDAAWNHCLVELRPADPGLSVLVVASPPGATLGDTVTRALGMLRDDDDAPLARFTRDEGIFLPVVAVEAPPVRFRLDDGGAPEPLPARSYGLLSFPRQLQCVTPFLVLAMERAARRPLLAVWVEDAGALALAGPQG